jgi:CBS domain-containing protein
MLATETLEHAVADGRQEQPLTDLVETVHVPHVHMDHALHLALERMSNYHLDVLPVVHRADIHKLEGIVTLRDVLDAYGVNTMDSAQL